ncbi:MAG: DUF2156 domain-containing protein [Spirochaetaceae bacterium]|nr:DUF2156 domain-containing protein [Spirochaetaceae bacterium]
MKLIPKFPDFQILTLDFYREIREVCLALDSGISEFSASCLCIHSPKYGYKISRWEDSLIISYFSPYKKRNEFIFLGKFPCGEVISRLFETHTCWTHISEKDFLENEGKFISWGLRTEEDRDSFDYLYFREDLASLSGRKFHKKKNLVNAFLAAHSPYDRPLDETTVPHALEILEKWNKTHHDNIPTDYEICKFTLENLSRLELMGKVIYVDDVPVGWYLGEIFEQNKMFCCHFEKADSDYKGAFQYVNRLAAESLPDYVHLINREQDLGDEGLRQAKLTYRPCGFVKKIAAFKDSV